MIDLETLGTSMTAPILEIGAVRFDKREVLSEFNVHVDPDSCFMMGARADGDTIKWWLQQSEAARKNAVQPGEPISAALNKFLSWVGANDQPESVWSHGANFDIPLIDQWLRRCRLAAPWKFWTARDTRTLYEFVGFRPQTKVVAHEAVADARQQALDVIEAWKRSPAR